MTAPQPIPLDSQLCFSLYGTTIAINRTYKPMLDALGITYPQYLVLSVLWEADGQTISVIADRLALEPSTITPLVKRLEAAGFVVRQRSTKDERLVGVHLTDKGRGLQAQTGCLTDTLLQRSGMTVEEIIALNESVQKLRDALVAPASE
ncbi:MULTISPECIES: MarR family winged helix-turn-helix transcriptional regulator [Rhizobiaceae]|uniref:MarR family winged helix-turn-helix transcriptional regulator n=1 Tax=Rhizobiaceae TaxID=82115 RepID=UPI00083CE93D|nr:MarR family transcriptional regulator [Sinorhizobium sp. RAC02]AOF92657.1 penicillinase repressor family protein [Sinorhizobium sp. RAC02]